MKTAFNHTILVLLFLFAIKGYANDGALSDLSQVSCDVPEVEKQALIDLYNATSGTNWTNNANWLSNSPICDWYGITVKNGHVDKIQLNQNGLDGILPESLDSLTDLTMFIASGNQLEGAIPNALGNLVNLITLLLNNNELSGEIPDFGQLKKLKSLYLFGNNLDGTIPDSLGELDSVEILSVAGNNLNGTIPSTLGNLSNLKILNLDLNELTGEIPASFVNLTNLTLLGLTGNQLSGAIPSLLGDLTKLQTLHLNKNKFTGNIPVTIAEIATLRILDVSDNQFAGDIPVFSNLSSFYIHTNKFVFKDFESEHLSYLETVTQSYEFSSQAKVDQSETKNVAAGESITFTSETLSSNNNSYQWYKTVNGVATAIVGATSKDFTITNVSDTDAGTYHFLSTNSIVSGLTLERNPITLTVEDSCEVSEAEKQALIALYNATNGSNWTNKTNWLTNAPVCDWYGVTVVDGKIEKLILENNNLTGVIPTDIDGLIYLKNLFLQKNNLSGTIPSEIGNLINLENLLLYENSLSGIVPTEIGGAISLVDLRLYDNDFTGGIPSEVGNLINLKRLFMHNNSLTGGIPSEIGILINLEQLYLYENNLSGVIPSEIGGGVGLKELRLNNNNFTGAIPSEIGNLINLTHLVLDDNDFTGVIPSTIGNLINLTHLYAKENNLIGAIPSEIGNLIKLKSLMLNNNDFTGEIPSTIGNLINLNWLSIYQNNLSGEIPSTIGNLTSLQYLYSSNNNLTGTIPSEIGNLSFLKHLDLGHNKLSGNISLTISSMNSLVQFIFGGNAFVFGDFESKHINYSQVVNYGYVPQAKVDLEETKNVIEGQSITLTSTALTSNNNSYQWYKMVNGVATAILGATSKDFTINNATNADAGVYHFLATNDIITGLTLERNPITLTLGADSCGISGEEKQALLDLYNATNGSNWKNTIANNKPWSEDTPVCDWYGVTVENGEVIQIKLNNNEIEGHLPTTLANLNNLSTLNLSVNQLTGNIPTELSNLTNLSNLNLAFNQLTGNIPSELGLLTNLNILSLSDNQLSGVIPLELGNLLNLNILSLGMNQLSGNIPSSIGNMSLLTQLSLVNNDLEGAIPTELGDLSNLEILWLGGNNLNGSIPSSLGNLGALIQLSLLYNDLEGEIPITLGNLSNLENFWVSNNNLKGKIPSMLNNMDALHTLVFNDNAFVFDDFETEHIAYTGFSNYVYAPQAKVDLEETKNVAVGESITLTSTALTSNNNSYQWYKMVNGVATAIVGATSKDFTISNVSDADAGVYHFLATNSIVTDLTLERNPITLTLEEDTCGVSADAKQALLDLYDATGGDNWKNTLENNQPWDTNISVCDWYGVTVSNGRVIKVKLPNNDLSGNLPTTLASLVDLTELMLTNNQLTGSIPMEIGSMDSLSRLSLGNNQLTGNIPSELGDLANLTALYLSSNQLSGTIPVELANLENLLFLDLVVNQLTGGIPSEFEDLSNLRNLSLANNQLSGSIPWELGSLSNLNLLSLGSNQLSGTIPSSFGDLGQLQKLMMGSNELEGEIPEELGNLTNLKILWLNRNALSGNIPSSMGNIGPLEQLLLNDNELEGEIPVEFSNLSNLKVVWLGNNNNLSGRIPSLLNSVDSFQQLSINGNAFVFSDFESEHVTYTGFSYYSYAPQAKVDEIETVSVSSGQSITLTSTALTSDNNNYQWFKRANGTTTLIANATSKDLTISNASEVDAGEYYFLATNNIVTGLTLERNPITLMVDVIDNAFCLSALSVEYPVVGDLVPQGDNIEWYLEETGGIALGKVEFISSEAESPGGKVYWWDDVNDALNARTALTVTVSANVPQVDPFQVFSEGLQATVGDLQAGGDIQWYLEPLGGAPLDPNVLLENGDYFAQMGASPCRAAVEVFIGTPLPEGDGYQLVCEGTTLEDLNEVFQLEDGASIVWYAEEEGGTTLNSSTALVNGTTYYAVQIDAYGFESEERKSVIVNMTSVFPPYVPNTEQTFYVNQSHIIVNLQAIGHDIRWYDQEIGGTVYAESEELEDGQIYYAEQTMNGCTSIRQGVLVRILEEEAPTLFGCEKFKPKTGDRYVINAWVREQGVNPINPDTRPFNGREESQLFVDLLNHLKEKVLSSELDVYSIPRDEYIPYSATEDLDFNALLAYVKDTEIDERKLIVYDFQVEKDGYGRTIGFSFALNRNKTSTFTYKSPKVRKNTGGIVTPDYRYPIRDNFENLTLEFKDVRVENGQFRIISDFSMQNAGIYSTTLTNVVDSDSGSSGIHSEVTFYDYEEILNYQPMAYANAMMEIVYKDENEQTMLSESLQFVPKGSVIEGWQQVSGSFIIPIDAYQMTLSLKNTASDINVYFDDLRFHPYDSNMKTFVYDPITQRLMSELDENNYATFYEYDEEGGLVRVKKETERGVFTIQETRSGNAKSTN